MHPISRFILRTAIITLGLDFVADPDTSPILVDQKDSVAPQRNVRLCESPIKWEFLGGGPGPLGVGPTNLLTAVYLSSGDGSSRMAYIALRKAAFLQKRLPR